jgi:hypothetical protein
VDRRTSHVGFGGIGLGRNRFGGIGRTREDFTEASRDSAEDDGDMNFGLFGTKIRNNKKYINPRSN